MTDSAYTFEPGHAADLLSLLANDTRLVILTLLRESEWDVGSLAQAIDLSQSAFSQHLRKMRDLKVVSTRRDAQTIYYSCKDERVLGLLTALETIYPQRVDLPAAA